MSENCFVKQEANAKLIENVVSFCSKCYGNIVENEIIFYDMQNYCYLCASCQSELAASLDINCEPLDSNSNLLFS